MGRTENLHVQPVRVVPPVIEGRGGDHGDATPGSDESTERTVETPHPDGTGSERGCGVQSRRQNQVCARDPGQDAAEVDGDVGGGPETVAPYGLVPGNIPLRADNGTGHRCGGTPDVPRNPG